MFMVKDELTNIKNLLRVRIKTQAIGFISAFVILSLVVFVPFSTTVREIVRSDFVRFYNIGDFSLMLFLGVGFAYFAQMLAYKNTNDKLSVYPQTNNSRFISSLLLHAVEVVALVSFALAAYLVRYGIILVLSVFMDNVYFALDFSLGLLIAGFFVFIAYFLLLVAVIELIGVILRKWTYYAIVVLTAVFSLVLSNLDVFVENALNALAFLIEEPSLIVFFLKAVALLIIIIAPAVVINHYTVYYKNHGRTLNKGAVIACIAITIIITGFLSSRMLQSSPIVGAGEVFRVSDFHDEDKEIRIDISHLPNGSNIELQIADRAQRIGVSTSTTRTTGAPVFVIREDSLRNIQGDTLIVSYSPTFFQVNSLRMSDFTDSRLIANLDGNVLFLDYEIDNVQVVFLPIWGIARQFDVFQNRNIFRENIIGIYSGGNITPSVWFRVE